MCHNGAIKIFEYNLNMIVLVFHLLAYLKIVTNDKMNYTPLNTPLLDSEFYNVDFFLKTNVVLFLFIILL